MLLNQIQDGIFDHIVCIDALYAVQNPQKLLKEFWRILKFGGLLILANPKKNIRKKRHCFLDFDCLGGILKKAGFRVICSELAYGDTDIFVVAAKRILKKDQEGNILSLEVAHTDEDFEAIYRLRYNVYCEEMHSLDPKDYPEKKEHDHCDAFSVHFLLRKNQEIIGTLRLIRETPRGFLMEESFALPKELDRSKMLEASRGLILKHLRGNCLFLLLFNAARTWSRERGYLYWCFTTHGKLADFFDSSGWKLHQIGQSASYHHYLVTPYICTL